MARPQIKQSIRKPVLGCGWCATGGGFSFFVVVRTRVGCAKTFVFSINTALFCAASIARRIIASNAGALLAPIIGGSMHLFSKQATINSVGAAQLARFAAWAKVADRLNRRLDSHFPKRLEASVAEGIKRQHFAFYLTVFSEKCLPDFEGEL